jgi:hypothetical protein
MHVNSWDGTGNLTTNHWQWRPGYTYLRLHVPVLLLTCTISRT